MSKGIWINDRDFVRFENAQGPSLSQEIATRKGSIDFYGLGSYLPDPDVVLRKAGKDLRVYRELSTDPHVWACIQSRKAGVMSLEWEIDRGKAQSRVAKTIRQHFESLDMHRILSDVLDAAMWGFQPIEVLWKNVGGLILPRDVVAKPPEWFHFSVDNELLLRTRENAMGVPVPDRKFLCPVFNGSYQNPYGERTLSRVFWPVTFKKGGLKFWVTFAEKFGTPWVIGKMPRGTDKAKIDDLAEMLEAMVADAVAVIPDDSSVEIIEAAGKAASGALWKDLAAFSNAEISKAILGHTGAAESTPGKLGSENAAIEVRKEIVDSDRKLAERTINQLIRWIHELNFTGAETPKFGMWEEEDVDLDLATRDKALSEAMPGRRLSSSYFVREYGLEETDIEDAPAAAAPQGVAPAAPDKTTFAHEGGCPHCSGHGVAGFADKSGAPALFPDQVALEEMIGSLSPEDLQTQMEGVLKPVLDLIEGGNSSEAILTSLSEAYPNMDNAAVEEMLTRAIFVSEVWGRLNARED